LRAAPAIQEKSALLQERPLRPRNNRSAFEGEISPVDQPINSLMNLLLVRAVEPPLKEQRRQIFQRDAGWLLPENVAKDRGFNQQPIAAPCRSRLLTLSTSAPPKHWFLRF
jgi:hypothetical protein